MMLNIPKIEAFCLPCSFVANIKKNSVNNELYIMMESLSCQSFVRLFFSFPTKKTLNNDVEESLSVMLQISIFFVTVWSHEAVCLKRLAGGLSQNDALGCEAPVVVAVLWWCVHTVSCWWGEPQVARGPCNVGVGILASSVLGQCRSPIWFRLGGLFE